MAELEQAIHLVDFSLGNTVEPVVANLAREEHETFGLQIKIHGFILRVLEVHSDT